MFRTAYRGLFYLGNAFAGLFYRIGSGPPTSPAELGWVATAIDRNWVAGSVDRSWVAPAVSRTWIAPNPE